jgi:hypothetical protein
MISQVRQQAPRVHLPLRQLALCLDCDEGFGLGPETCPSCGGATWTSLSRFLGQASTSRPGRRLDGSPAAANGNAEQPARVRHLVIVARNRRHLYEYLERAFAGNDTIRVSLDRRVVERRAPSGPYAVDRRHGDRRSSRKIDGLLRAIGWVIVPLGVPETHRGAPIISAGEAPSTSIATVVGSLPTAGTPRFPSRHGASGA